MKNIWIVTVLLFFISCNTTNESKESENQEEYVESETPITWEKKTFKLDENQDFHIDVNRYEEGMLLKLSFSRSTAFQTELENTTTLLDRIQNEVNLYKTTHVVINPIYNKEFLNDIVLIPEIQENIKKNENEGNRWIDFRVVEENIHKSKLVQQFIDLFHTHGLKAENYSIEKCSYHRLEDESENNSFEMYCPSLRIKMINR